MDRPKMIVTVTDGVPCDYLEEYRARPRATIALRRAGVLSLSCCIGDRDVDHDGLSELARDTGGLHLKVRDSADIAHAMARLTEFILAVTVSRSTAEVDPNGVRVAQATLSQVSVARVAVDVYLLLDHSWSMFGCGSSQSVETPRSEWNGDPNKMPRAKEAAVKLISSLNPQYDRVGVGQFCGEYKRLRSLTHEFDSCIWAIRSIRGGGCSLISNAIAQAAEEFM